VCWNIVRSDAFDVGDILALVIAIVIGSFLCYFAECPVGKLFQAEAKISKFLVNLLVSAAVEVRERCRAGKAICVSRGQQLS